MGDPPFYEVAIAGTEISVDFDNFKAKKLPLNLKGFESKGINPD